MYFLHQFQIKTVFYAVVSFKFTEMQKNLSKLNQHRRCSFGGFYGTRNKLQQRCTTKFFKTGMQFRTISVNADVRDCFHSQCIPTRCYPLFIRFTNPSLWELFDNPFITPALHVFISTSFFTSRSVLVLNSSRKVKIKKNSVELAKIQAVDLYRQGCKKLIPWHKKCLENNGDYQKSSTNIEP